MQAALEEAKKGRAEGGIPIGSVLVRDGKIIGRGHNQRVQKDDHVLKEVYMESGAIASMPKWYKFGIMKIILNIIVFICIGSLISKSVVNFLDENDIFKPEDDDNDEDDD